MSEGQVGGDTGGDTGGEGTGTGDGGTLGGGLGSGAGLGEGGVGEGGEGGEGVGDRLPAIPEWAKEYSQEAQELVARKNYADPEAVVQAYLHAERKLGASPDRLLELPADMTDATAMGDVYKALGRPENAEAYDLPNLADDPESQALAGKLSAKAWELGYTQTQWRGLQEAFSEVGEESKAMLAQANEEKEAAGRSELKRMWGDDYKANLDLIDATVARLGMSDEISKAMVAGAGVKEANVWALAVARMMGEPNSEFDNFGDGGKFMDPETARAEWTRLKADKPFMEKLNAGDTEAVARRDRLIEIYSEDEGHSGREVLA